MERVVGGRVTRVPCAMVEFVVLEVAAAYAAGYSEGASLWITGN